MELVKVENNQIVLAEELCEKMAMLADAKEKCEQLEGEVKAQLKAAMEANGIKSWENQFFKATVIAERTTKRVDTQSLKLFYPDIYDELLKESVTSSSLRITYKKVNPWEL